MLLLLRKSTIQNLLYIIYYHIIILFKIKHSIIKSNQNLTKKIFLQWVNKIGIQLSYNTT